MTIAEMHVNFRNYAQQMGMQNVRAILPEQIDILINQSISDMINQLIRENISSTNDRVITDNSKIGQINAFRTLYDVKEVPIKINDNFTYNPLNRLQGLIKHIHQNISDNNGEDNVLGKYMFLVDLSINYLVNANGKTNTGTDLDNTDLSHEHVDDVPGAVDGDPDETISPYLNYVPLEANNTIAQTDIEITSWYPVRIIDSAYLSDTLQDYVLKNRFRSPIACIYKNDTIELYIDKFKKGTNAQIEILSGLNTITLTPYKLRIDLIKYPNIVKFVEDVLEEGSVDCDLPESMHGEIIKRAVDLYHASVSGSLLSSQQNVEQQRMENNRNNYRNEGYQQND